MIRRFFDVMLGIIGLVKFKLKYPGTRWIRPRKIGTFYSQDGQDLYLASLLFGSITKNTSEEHWVVDVGCNHPVHFSNSLFFEKYFKCKILAIDPIEEFGSLWQKKRPSAIFYPCAIGELPGSTILNVPLGNGGDSMFSYVESGVNKRPDISFEARTVPILRLSDLFLKYGIKEILFMSIDVEGFELSALKGIDFDAVLIRCIIVENNSTSWYGSDDIRVFLSEYNYDFYARIGHLDDVYIHGSMTRGT
jgi:FkbM family methyltransferase